MRSQRVDSPTNGKVYSFSTSQLEGTSYVIINQTANVLYVTDQAVVNVQSAKSSLIAAINPQDQQRIGYIQSNNLCLCLDGEIGISQGSATASYIAVVTVAANEDVSPLVSSGAFATYNASAVDSVLPVTSQTITVAGYTTLATMDLSGWGGFYFQWAHPNVPGTFLEVRIQASSDNVTFVEVTRAMGSAGYFGMPKVARHMRVIARQWYMDSTLNTPLVWGVSIARVSSPIDPVVSLKEDVFPLTASISLGAGAQGGINIPANGGKTRLIVSQTGAAATSVLYINPTNASSFITSVFRLPLNSIAYEDIYTTDSSGPQNMVVLSAAAARIITVSYTTCERIDV